MRCETMRKKLLVSGCSFTQHTIKDDGIKKRWCHHVADKLDMDLVNLGKRGAGNEYIFSSIYDYIEDNSKPDMVIAAWSKCHRRDYKMRGLWMNDRLDIRGDEQYHLQRTDRYKRMLNDFCEYRGINYKGFQMIELRDGETIRDGDTNNVQAQTIGFARSLNEDFISDTNRHPSELGHEKIGKYIYENL